MAKGSEIAPIPAREPYGVVLPCPQDQFAEFITSLLGKPQTIERQVSGIFEITKGDLIKSVSFGGSTNLAAKPGLPRTVHGESYLRRQLFRLTDKLVGFRSL